MGWPIFDDKVLTCRMLQHTKGSLRGDPSGRSGQKRNGRAGPRRAADATATETDSTGADWTNLEDDPPGGQADEK